MRSIGSLFNEEQRILFELNSFFFTTGIWNVSQFTTSSTQSSEKLILSTHCLAVLSLDGIHARSDPTFRNTIPVYTKPHHELVVT